MMVHLPREPLSVAAELIVRIGDWRTGRPAGRPLTGNTGRVQPAAGPCEAAPPVIVGGSCGVGVWRLADGRPAAKPLTGPHRLGEGYGGGRCETAPGLSSVAASTARCVCGGWLTVGSAWDVRSSATRPGSR